MGLANPSQHYHIQVSMLNGDTSTGNNWCALQRGTNTSTRAAGFGFYGNVLRYCSNSTWYNCGTFTANTWYTFDCYVNTASGVYTLYVNGSCVASDVPLWVSTAGPSDTIYFWRSYTSGAGCNFAVDSITCQPYDAVTIVQWNSAAGGIFDINDHTTQNYGTQDTFAAWVAGIGTGTPGINSFTASHPEAPVAVIAVEEMMTDYRVNQLVSRLQTNTGVTWNSCRYPGGQNNFGGEALFWRPDLVDDLGDMGSVTLDWLEVDSPPLYALTYGGRLFQQHAGGSGEKFAVFAGKLAWDSAKINGHNATDTDRTNEANALKDWVRTTSGMVNYPNTARVICTDLNSDRNSSVWNAMNSEYADPSDFHTWVSSWDWCKDDGLLNTFGTQIDYIWWDYDAYGKVPGGFAAGPWRTPYNGSDHRGSWAYIMIH